MGDERNRELISQVRSVRYCVFVVGHCDVLHDFDKLIVFVISVVCHYGWDSVSHWAFLKLVSVFFVTVIVSMNSRATFPFGASIETGSTSCNNFSFGSFNLMFNFLGRLLTVILTSWILILETVLLCDLVHQTSLEFRRINFKRCQWHCLFGTLILFGRCSLFLMLWCLLVEVWDGGRRRH